jgi:hypothetical protein
MDRYGKRRLRAILCVKNISFRLFFTGGFEVPCSRIVLNTSLGPRFDLCRYRDSGVIVLVDGPRTNKTLKCLDLSVNSALSQSGRAAIEDWVTMSERASFSRVLRKALASILIVVFFCQPQP